MNNSAYISGSLNCALIFKNNKAEIIDGATGESRLLDGYLLSQFKAINPEIKEVQYKNIDEIKSYLEAEHKKQEALTMALEVMDTSFSEQYRLGIAKLLDEAIADDASLVTFIKNRFYGTPLPVSFEPSYIISQKGKFSETFTGLYENLEAKTRLFAAFYTLLQLLVNAEATEIELLNSELTDNGCYAAFTEALYIRSRKKYEGAEMMAIPVLEKLHLFGDKNLFNTIETKLSENYKIIFLDAAYKSTSEIIDLDKTVDDPIIQLIENYFSERQEKHDKKLSKRGGAKRVKDFDWNIVSIVLGMKDRLINYEDNSNRFFREFESVVEKQLRSGHAEHLCKTCCDLATIFIDKNRLEIAEKLLRYARLLNEEDSFVYNLTANLYQKQNKFNKALHIYDIAIKKFNDDPVAYNGKAEILRDIGKMKEALKYYDLSILRFDNNPIAYNGKAGVLRDMGKLREALEHYEWAIQRFSDDSVAYCGKAEVLRDMRRFADALECYDATILKFGNNPIAYCGKAEVLRDIGNLTEALNVYEYTIRLFPENAYSQTGRAEVLKELGRAHEALKQYDSSILKFGHDAVLYSGRAELLWTMNKREEALKQYEEMIKLFSYEQYSRRSKMQFLLEMGKYEKFSKLVKKDNYITKGDYVELHMYCIYLLKTGDWDMAKKKINIGLKSPFIKTRKNFKKTHAYLNIINNEFSSALADLESIESIAPSQSLLLIHANAEINNKSIAIEEVHKLEDIKRPIIHTTLCYLSEKYSLNGFKKSGKSKSELDTLIKEGEMLALMQY